MKWRWPWMKRGDSPGVVEARERLEAAERDDDRIDLLVAKTQRILRENNLAPQIMRALGVRR